MYPSKRGYYDNSGTKEMCYIYSHINSIFTNEDESKNLGNYIAKNDSNITDIYDVFGEIVGNEISSGLQVLPQNNPNMSVQVIDGIMRKSDGTKLNIIGKNLITVDASSSSQPRKDIIYLESDLSTIGYTKGSYPTIIAGSETYSIDTNAQAEMAGSKKYTITTNFVGAIAGSNTYSLTTNFVADDTITFEGVTFTAVASGATENQFNIGTDTTISMANLASVLNSNTSINAIYNAVESSNTITITENNVGHGNTPSNMVITGTGVISNGTAINSKSADTITFNNNIFTATSSITDSSNFIVGSDVMATATNLEESLNYNTNITNLYTITVSSNVITLTEKIAGGGNTPNDMNYTGTGVISNGTATISKINDTVEINGITFTAVNSGATNNEFNVGIDTDTTATNLATSLNENTGINTHFNATVNNNIITLTEKSIGNGNTPTIAITTGKIKITNGTITVSKTNMPVTPTKPNGAFLLAEINIYKNMSVINNSDIIDKRNLVVKLENKQNKINMIDTNKISINHNGSCYPFVRILYTDNFTKKTYNVKSELEYDDENNINIYIEDDYIGTNGILNKENDNKYTMNYDQGILTIIFNYMT